MTNPIRSFALRDGTITLVALVLWWALASHSGGDGWTSDLAGLLAGSLMGATAFLAHEWGHLAGARLASSKIELATEMRASFLFSFDSRRNSLPQFLTMSFGGFLATGAMIWVFYTYLPDGLLASRIARGLGVFLATLGVTLEVPLVLYSLRGQGLPQVETFQSDAGSSDATA